MLWCSVEDSALLVGPPRMGKGLHLVIPWVLDAPGPVVTTSTRPDTLAVTFHARQARGPVSVFDPQRLAGLADGLRWSPVRGCETPRTALVRARGLAAGTGTAILIVEHKTALLADLADEVALMAAGRIVAVGPTADILADERLVELGVEPPPAVRIRRAAAARGLELDPAVLAAVAAAHLAAWPAPSP